MDGLPPYNPLATIRFVRYTSRAMQSTDQSSLTFDTYDMTVGETAKRRAQLEGEGWIFSHEIRVLDTFKRVHVHLLFKRAVQVGDYPGEDIVLSSGFKESDEPRYEARPHRGVAYYLLTVIIAFSLFILLHPQREAAIVAAGVTVERREIVIPASVKANDNAAQPTPIKRKKKRADRKASERLLDAGGNAYRAEGGGVLPY